MRRSRKPVWAVSSIEGSNPSLSAYLSAFAPLALAARVRRERMGLIRSIGQLLVLIQSVVVGWGWRVKRFASRAALVSLAAVIWAGALPGCADGGRPSALGLRTQ